MKKIFKYILIKLGCFLLELKKKLISRVLKIHRKMSLLINKNKAPVKVIKLIPIKEPSWFILPQLKTTILLEEKVDSYLRSNIISKCTYGKCLAYDFIEKIKEITMNDKLYQYRSGRGVNREILPVIQKLQSGSSRSY